MIQELITEDITIALVAQRLKCLPGMQETRVRSLGQKDPLEKEMATHFNILAGKIPWTERSLAGHRPQSTAVTERSGLT